MPEPTPSPENPIYEPNIRFLKMMCILTFAGSGLYSLIFGIIAVFYNFFQSLTPSYFEEYRMNEDKLNVLKESMDMISVGGRYYFILNSLLFAISFAGAVRMWNLRKSGFQMYTVSQILLLITPMLFIKGFQMPWISVLLTAMFIFSYSGYIKKMN
jgi:hypothetical protein